MTDKVQALLSWCGDNGIFIDSRLDITEDQATGSIAVYNNSDAFIEAPATLVKIPKRAVLSARSCWLAEEIPYVPYGYEAQLGLSLALYSELLRGSESRWSGYLQSLPQSAVDIALLWGCDQLPQGRDQGQREDDRQARAWAAGTELSRQVGEGRAGVNRALDEAREYYATVALPMLSRHMHRASFSLSGFLHAYSLVSSRAFLVDAYHGLSMVPIADAFNHIQDNHVHLESDYDVCVTCGSFAPCVHDEDDVTAGANARARPSDISSKAPRNPDRHMLAETNAKTLGVYPNSARINAKTSAGTDTPRETHGDSVDINCVSEEVDTCDMVSNLPIAPHSEIFNTYGEHLTNAQLLARYGFVIEGNENDIVSFGLEDIRRAWHLQLQGGDAGSSPPVHQPDWDVFAGVLRQVVQLWPRYDRWRESRLVYQPHHNATSTVSAFHALDESVNEAWAGEERHDWHGIRPTTPLLMWINSDARLSHGLWVCFVLLALMAVPTPERAAENMEDRTQQTVAVLRRLAERQLYWEALSEANANEALNADADDDEGPVHPPNEETISQMQCSSDDEILAAVADVVLWACTQSPRAKRLGCPRYSDEPLSTEEIGNKLDDLPPAGTRRTRLALLLVLGERSVLESCRCAWEDFADVLRQRARGTIT